VERFYFKILVGILEHTPGQGGVWVGNKRGQAAVGCYCLLLRLTGVDYLRVVYNVKIYQLSYSFLYFNFRYL